MMLSVRSTALNQPNDAEHWAEWFRDVFLPDWMVRASDPAHGGFFDALDQAGFPVAEAPKTVLAQARLAFTFAHLADLAGDARFEAAAADAFAILPRFRKALGLYCRAVNRDGGATGEPGDAVARSYDQSFVILALATRLKLHPSAETEAELEDCWAAIQANLRDPATGLLLEDDSVTDPAHPDAPMRAQNPHMHLYEAALQAFEMTGKPQWLERASSLRALGLRHFFDGPSGTIAEFLAPDLSRLAGQAGNRREIGHQCEWAWLLRREMALGGRDDLSEVVSRLEGFALAHGFSTSGPLDGAAFDAVGVDGGIMEERFLLWPQTEAIKMHSVRHMAGEAGAAAQGIGLLELMFERYFRDRPVFVNQLDGAGAVLWPEALSRLLYHIVLALTEGARAGLWPVPTRNS
jgi:mannose/cellobiose epimerase-like protein (N-acyl-D-glucosamine 2-epimerase family)